MWFQLTQTVETFISIPASGPLQIELYTNFISTFESKVNQLKLAKIGIVVARQFSDGTAALEFLTKLSEKVNTPLTQEAFVLASMEVSHFNLLLGEMETAKTLIDSSEKILEGMDSVEMDVNAGFYRVSGDYYKAKAEYANYYKNSLLYLACINVATDLNAEERVQRAHDLGLSALLGSIYNFGELLQHTILDSLVATEFEWIKDLLFAFNSGDINKFEELVPNLSKQPILQENYAFLRQKICLMALIESVFKRPTTDRVLPFSIIAKETKLPSDEVEHLVMKALSLKLIKGSLDQFSSTATVSWVQPRVLDATQISGLRDRLTVWCDKVDTLKLGLTEIPIAA